MRAHPRAADKRNACTHTRCFTCSHSAELQLVLRALVYTHVHRRTQKRHGGACRPHKCACVRDEFIPLCLVHVHAYVNTRFALIHGRKHVRQTHCAASKWSGECVGAPVISFRFDKVASTRMKEISFLLRNAPSPRVTKNEIVYSGDEYFE